MDPGPLGLADALLDDVDEGGHVVVGDPLALGHRLDEARRRPSGRGRARRAAPPSGADARFGQGLDREQLDLEPRGRGGPRR